MRVVITGAKIRIASVLMLVAFLSGCIPQQGNRGVQTLDNPLKGMELNLAYLDVVNSMHKVNTVLLKEMPISADAQWPELLQMPKFATEEEKKAYRNELELMLSKDFSFFDYYGDFDISDLFSIKGLVERPIIEIAQNVALNVEHQRKVLCGKDACEFFGMPLEEQIMASLESRGINAWVSAPVGADNLRPVRALTSSPYKNFEKAFDSLLPPSKLDAYSKAVSEYRLLAEKKTLLEGDIKSSEIKLKEMKNIVSTGASLVSALSGNIGKQPPEASGMMRGFLNGVAPVSSGGETADADRITLDDVQQVKGKMQETADALEVLEKEKVPAMKVELKELEQELKVAEATYLKLLEEAMVSPEVTEENYHLAKNMVHVVEAIDDNLDRAVFGATFVTAKVVGDVVYMSEVVQQEGWKERILASMTVEIMRKSNMKLEVAKKLAEKRLELILVRSVLFVPNLYQAYAEAISMKFLLDPQIEYMNEIIAGWESLYGAPEDKEKTKVAQN